MNKANRERNLAIIQEMTLMDDVFMTVFFDGHPECIEEVLDMIFTFKVEVLEVKTQADFQNIHGCSVIFDIIAQDAEKRLFDIEIQRANKGADVKRARYYSSLLDTRAIEQGEDFGKIKDTYVIFITENDVLKGREPIYNIDRKIIQTDKYFDDGEHIIYINTSYRGDGSTKIEKLIKCFTSKAAQDIPADKLRERFTDIKTGKAEKEEYKMCELLEKIVQKERAEGNAEGHADVAENMLRAGNFTVESIAQLCSLTVEQVLRIKEKISA